MQRAARPRPRPRSSAGSPTRSACRPSACASRPSAAQQADERDDDRAVEGDAKVERARHARRGRAEAVRRHDEAAPRRASASAGARARRSPPCGCETSMRELGAASTAWEDRAVADELSRADRSSLAAERGPVNMSMLGALVIEPGARRHARDAVVARDRGAHPPAAALPPAPRAAGARARQPGLGRRRRLRRPLARAPRDAAARRARRATSRRTSATRPRGGWTARGRCGSCTSSRACRAGALAVVPKMHHALLDGIAALGVGDDPARPDARSRCRSTRPPRPWSPRPFAMRRQLARIATLADRRAPSGWRSTPRRARSKPRRSAPPSDVVRAAEMLSRARAAAPARRRTCRSTARSRPSRSLRDGARAADRRQGRGARRAAATVNDVVLAAVAGCSRGYLEDAGIDAAVARARPRRARAGERAPRGRRERRQPLLARLRRPAGRRADRARADRAARRARRPPPSASAASRAGSLIIEAAGFGPPLMASMLARASGDRSPMNIVVSNVPGPQFPFYLERLRGCSRRTP